MELAAQFVIKDNFHLWGLLHCPAIYFPRVILYTFFSFLLIYDDLGFGFWGWGLGSVFWGCSFQFMGFGACNVGLSGFFGVGALYINKKNTPGKKNYAWGLFSQILTWYDMVCVTYCLEVRPSIIQHRLQPGMEGTSIVKLRAMIHKQDVTCYLSYKSWLRMLVWEWLTTH